MRILGYEIDLDAIPEIGYMYKIEKQGIVFDVVFTKGFCDMLNVQIKLGSVYNRISFFKESLDDPGFLPYMDRMILNCMFNNSVVNQLLYEA